MGGIYMTLEKYNERKRRMRYEAQDHSLIKDLYPLVLEIVVEYTTSHLSPFGEKIYTGKHSYSPDNRNVFEIDCPNCECSVGFFNLQQEIRDMVRSKQIESSGTKICNGDEANDHPEQRCDSILKYKIYITYTDNGI